MWYVQYNIVDININKCVKLYLERVKEHQGSDYFAHHKQHTAHIQPICFTSNAHTSLNICSLIIYLLELLNSFVTQIKMAFYMCMAIVLFIRM